MRSEDLRHVAPLAPPPGEAWRERIEAAERALREIPDSRFELGRRIESDLGFRARAETVQALVALAELNKTGLPDAVRRAFAVHVVAAETIRVFWNTLPLGEALQPPGTAGLVWLIEASEWADGRLVALREAAPKDHAETLRAVRDALVVDAEPLRAALVLGAEIERVVHGTPDGGLDETLPGLTPGELQTVRGAILPDQGADRRPERALVDGILLRTLMERHLAAGHDVDADQDAEPFIRQLAADKLAYRFVSQQLQARCAELLQARRQDAADTAGWIQKALFASYLKVSRVLTGDSAAVHPPADGSLGSPSLDDRLSAKIREAELAAEEIRAEQAGKREVVEKAVEPLRRLRIPLWRRR